MTHVHSYFTNEFKLQFFQKKKLFLLLIFFLLCLYTVITEVESYKQVSSTVQDFQRDETLRFGVVSNYTEYSVFGIQAMFKPSPASIFINNHNNLSELCANVNSIATLKIFANLKGNSLKNGKSSTFRFKLSDIFLYVGILLALLLGAEPMKEKEYLKMLTSRYTKARLFAYLTISRFIIISLSFVTILSIMIGYALINCIGFSSADIGVLTGYTLKTLLIYLVFLVAGIGAGSLPRANMTHIAVASLWGLFVLIIPVILLSISDDNLKNLPTFYQIKSNKLKTIDIWEKKIESEYGKTNLDNIETERKIVESYFNDMYPNIEALETKLIDDIEEISKRKSFIAVISPVSMYTSMCSEMSSVGYENYIKFCRFLVQLQRKFVRFWIDRVYYNDPKVMVNFVKNDENIFKAKSALPANFGVGMAINALYLLLALAVSFILFRRLLVNMALLEPGEAAKLLELDVDMKNWETATWKVPGPNFRNILYNLLLGRSKEAYATGFGGKLRVKGEEITTGTKRRNFFYLCAPANLPADIKTINLIRLFGSLNKVPRSRQTEIIDNFPELNPYLSTDIGKLDSSQKCEVLLLLTYLVKADIYLMDDIGGQTVSGVALRLLKRIRELENDGALCIYLTSDLEYKPIEKNKPLDFSDGRRWMETIEFIRLEQPYKAK